MTCYKSKPTLNVRMEKSRGKLREKCIAHSVRQVALGEDISERVFVKNSVTPSPSLNRHSNKDQQRNPVFFNEKSS